MALDLDQDLQAALKNKMGNFYGAYLQKAYARAQGKDIETENIASRSRQIGRKLQAQTNKESPPGLNKEPAKDLFHYIKTYSGSF